MATPRKIFWSKEVHSRLLEHEEGPVLERFLSRLPEQTLLELKGLYQLKKGRDPNEVADELPFLLRLHGGPK